MLCFGGRDLNLLPHLFEAESHDSTLAILREAPVAIPQLEDELSQRSAALTNANLLEGYAGPICRPTASAACRQNGGSRCYRAWQPNEAPDIKRLVIILSSPLRHHRIDCPFAIMAGACDSR